MTNAKNQKLVRNIAVICLYLLGEEIKDIAYRYSLDKSSIYQIINLWHVPRRGYKFRYKQLKIQTTKELL